MWVNDIESKIVTRLEAEATKALKDQFPNIRFTRSDKVDTKAKFPTVYIHTLGSPEIGQDIEGTSFNATMYSVQIEVTDNVSQGRIDEVMDVIVGTMKKMRFSVTTPEFQNTNSVYRSVARFRRLIGASDKL